VPEDGGTREVESRPTKVDVDRQRAAAPPLLTVVQKFLTLCERRGIKKKHKPLKSGTITARKQIFSQVLPQLRGPRALENSKKDGLPDWSERSIREISKRDIEGLIETIGGRRKLPFRGRVDDGAEAQANNTFFVFRTFFRWAKREGYIDIDPIEGLEQPFAINVRKRWLDDNEIRLLWDASVAIGYPFGPIIQLLLLTRQREDEVAGIPRRELDWPEPGQWTIRRDTKTTEEGHIVPLSEFAREIIESLPRIAGTDLLFTLNGQTPVSAFSDAKGRIDRLMLSQYQLAGGDPKAVEVPGWTFHDLRRTATTIMARLGHDPYVVDKILNHANNRSGSGPKGTISGIMAVYNVYDYLPQRTAALEDLGRHIKRLVERDRPSNRSSIRTERSKWSHRSQPMAAPQYAAPPPVDEPRAVGREPRATLRRRFIGHL
jgi:integrase